VDAIFQGEGCEVCVRIVALDRDRREGEGRREGGRSCVAGRSLGEEKVKGEGLGSDCWLGGKVGEKLVEAKGSIA
jgi:hypothetical protein